MKRLTFLISSLMSALLLALACSPVFAVERTAGRRLAVIIGVRLRPEDTLNYTFNDARLMRAVIGGTEEETWLLTSDEANPERHPTRENILKALEQCVQAAKPEDTLYFYYSGHGMQWLDDGRSYLVPQQERAQIGAKGKEGLIAVANIRAKLATAKARTSAVILDACHSGSTKAGRLPNLEQTFGSQSGVVTLAGCKVGQTSLEIPSLRHGLFTFFLARGLSGADSPTPGQPVTLQWLESYVTERVRRFLKECAPPGLQDHPMVPVFLYGNSQGETPVGTSNPQAVANTAVPTSPVEVRPMRPLPPGILLTLRAGEGIDARRLGRAETSLRRRLLERGYPVIAPELAAQFEAVLNDRNTPVAAEQARSMNAHFLLRGELQLRAGEERFDTETVYTAEVTLTVELIDAEGRVVAAEDSDSAAGITVKKGAASPQRAADLALAEAGRIAAERLLRQMERPVRPLFPERKR